MAAETGSVPAARRAGTGARRRSREEPKVRQPRARAHRSTIILRWCVVAVLGFVALLYYRPLANYAETRAELNEREAEVRELRAERERLDARLARSSTVEALSREARRIGLVREGERLFIVKGIARWRRNVHSDG